MKENFAIGYSFRSSEEEAIKDIFLNMRPILRGHAISFSLVLFTPPYSAKAIRSAVYTVFRPFNVIGIQSPWVVFQEKLLRKGIVMVCFCWQGKVVKGTVTLKNDLEQIELNVRKEALDAGSKKDFMFLSLSPGADPMRYLRAIALSLGKGFKIIGGGFCDAYDTENFQLFNETIHQGASSVLVGGMRVVRHYKIGGFLPVGKTFTITKAAPVRRVILEIDGRPAAEIYKKYLGEEYSRVTKSDFFQMYPIGLREKKGYKIIVIQKILGDDSLFCLDEVRSGTQAKLMIATQASLLDEAKRFKVDDCSECFNPLAIVVLPVLRKKVLRFEAEREVALIKRGMAKNIPMIGWYADYAFSFDFWKRAACYDSTSTCVTIIGERNE